MWSSRHARPFSAVACFISRVSREKIVQIFLLSGICTGEALNAADSYDDRMCYISYDIFYVGLANASGTVYALYEIDNSLNVDYGLRHDYVMELRVILVDCDNFFARKHGYFGMFVILGHACWNLPAL